MPGAWKNLAKPRTQEVKRAKGMVPKVKGNRTTEKEPQPEKQRAKRAKGKGPPRLTDCFELQPTKLWQMQAALELAAR